MEKVNFNMSNYAPCKDCPKRKLGCHSDCADYAEFRQDIDYSHKQRRIHAESFIPSRGYIKNAKSLKRILNK